jgi:hypothetical protein
MKDIPSARKRLAAAIRRERDDLRGTCRNAKATLSAQENERLKEILFKIRELAEHVEENH